jgi:Flp pilus assembly protein CpaB
MLAALFGILSAALMFAFLSSRDSGGDELTEALNTAGGAETVIVVARNVNVGERITQEMLTTQSVPTAALLEGRVAGEDVEQLIGKVATAPMFLGEQALLIKVTSYEGQDTLAYKVPEGMRSLSLQIPHEAWAAAGLVQPGDRVDVLGVTTFIKVDPLTGEEEPNVLSGMIAQNVEVLAVSQVIVKVIPNVDGTVSRTPVSQEEFEAANGDAGTTTTTGSGTQPVVNGAQVKADPNDPTPTYEAAISITLALTPEQAAKVAIIDALKDDVGQYRILARQKGDGCTLSGDYVWSFEDLFTPSAAESNCVTAK